MNPCETNLSASALACAISKGKTRREINALAAFFTQLGDSLATINAFDELNEECSDRMNK